MLRLALAFLVIALIAAVFGFNLIAGYSWEIGKLLFIVFLVLAVISFAAGAFRGRAPV
jgi:uncharacterized membrane protein YtjA (UPF0391 family)